MVEVRLDPQEWNQLLQILAQAPWNVANPLIMKIGEQLRAQAAPEARPKGNTHEADETQLSDRRAHSSGH
jgi:hypothetical protein